MTDIATVSSETSEISPISNLPPEIQERIRAASQQIQDTSSTNVKRITFKESKYFLPDGSEASAFTGIVLASKHANVFYPNAYDKNNIQPPTCLAIADIGQDIACKDLKPHDMIDEPQNDDCGSCPNFQFGSALVGRGKACPEQTLLAVYIPSIDDNIYVLEEKKANSSEVDAYLKGVVARATHPIAVTTEFSIDDWVQTFSIGSIVAPELLDNLARRIPEAEELLYNRVVSNYRKPVE